MIKMVTAGLTIFLPNPMFGDQINYQQSLKQHRTIRGKTFYYVKRKGRSKQVFKILMTREKSVEFQTFFDAAVGREVVFTNHNNETWIGRIINNPIEAVAKSTSEMTEIGFEFEGIKV